ncbi:MAG: phage virion morphogenesis protein [Bacteroidales bacterium]|nr:phage virion morphogenesis protein [Bacteroidales bacterium]
MVKCSKKPEEFQQRLNSLQRKFKDLYNEVAPAIAGNVAVRLFKKNFQDEGFFGQAWKEVKRRENPWTRGAAASRGILTGNTGDLGRSIEYKIEGDGKVIIFTNPSEFVHSKEPYGRVHNEGLRSGRGSGFIMPKRQFIGDHPELRRAIIDELERKLKEFEN